MRVSPTKNTQSDNSFEQSFQKFQIVFFVATAFKFSMIFVEFALNRKNKNDNQ